MKFLGIDPGYATTGYGIIENDANILSAITYGVIETPVGLPFPARLQTIYLEIQRLLRTFSPKAVAMEELYFNRGGGRASNAMTMLRVAQARGVILLAIEQAGLDVYEYKPSEIKQAVTGHGSADKAQVQQMVKLVLGLTAIPKPDDAADALAVGICGLNSYRAEEISMSVEKI